MIIQSETMTRVAWVTDIHLDFVDSTGFDQFVDQLQNADPDVVLIGGDIAEARSVSDYLCRLDDLLRRPLCFVLGNHDYYHGSITAVRADMDELCRQRPMLNYLTHGQSVQLADGVGLLGHDGWSDARFGDYDRSLVELNDYRLIQELAGWDKVVRQQVLQALGDQAAEHIRTVLPVALEAYRCVFLLTHVPPVRQACRYYGNPADDDWVPHFTCKAMGDALLDIMAQHPDHRLTVLCGHTHCPAETQPLPNLTIYTGGAVYGKPALIRIFELACAT